MPVIGAAAITGAAAIGGGVIAAKGAKNAAKAQENAAREAIAYQERQQRERQARYDAAYADYRTRYDKWLKDFFGVEPSTSSSDGVHALTSGGARGIAPSAVAPMVAQSAQGDTIADLIRGIGAIRANSASTSGDIWGNALTRAGAGIGKAINDRPATPKTTVETSLDTSMFRPGGWNDWDQYLYSGGELGGL